MEGGPEKKNDFEICSKKIGECNPFDCDTHVCINQEKREKPITNFIIERNPDIPCKIGHLIKSECRISSYIVEWANSNENAHKFVESTSFQVITGEVIRTLKSSSNLAFIGQYRSAMDLFRSAIEVFVTGLYYDLYEKGNGEKWLGGLVFPSFKNCLNTLRDEKLISGELYKEIDKIYGPLNKYVHSYDARAFACSQEDYSGCPVEGFYSDELINGWFDTFQVIMKWILDWYTSQVPEILDNEKTKLWFDAAKICIFDKEED
jgi:hypothetical protein